MTSAQVMPDYDNRKSIEDDSSLTPAVPGVTDDHGNGLDISSEDVRELEQALAHGGYDPGVIDGVFDDETRAAINEFQSDHSLVATGIIDAETGEWLGVVISQSS